MGAGHTVGHAAGPPATVGGAYRRRMLLAIAVTGTVLVLQVVGGLLSGSLALLADSGHMLTDLSGVTLALVAVQVAQRSPTLRRTFGHYRLEILAALANSALQPEPATTPLCTPPVHA
ncbi:cation diffusion facilitator family transporter [Kitasatospora sp. RG8]|uniref:cation diffusion facilitator family transporter n=1 Tax=Kitasatospora sp. RG8 TaxID=2820815 RepID=UPI001ADFA9B5|nr:cation diffusion facilitator family transporter [Kitasatospora sp. RG8]MBP0452827.1 cation diffusion facilitator family transporter [Kitasatospora sp. RG8]